jgi:hypothetical protein
VFARGRSLRVIGSVGAAFLLSSYAAPIALAAAQPPTDGVHHAGRGEAS